ncbi:MAG: acetolactate synthase large subunit, partial [Verrucomicrobiota bacterium]
MSAQTETNTPAASTSAPTGELAGSDIVIESLIREGVTDIFAYPGGASMEMHQSLAHRKDRIRTILPR